MALRPSSFIRNPFLLFVLCAAIFGAAAFFTCGSSCPATKAHKVTEADLARVHVQASNQVAEAKVKEVAEAPKSTKGWLGIHIQTLNAERAQRAGVKTNRGVLILGLQQGMPAETAGFRPHDVVTHFNGRPVNSACQLKKAVGSSKPDTRIPVRVMRGNMPVVLYPTLTNSPADGKFARGCQSCSVKRKAKR